MFRRGGTSSVVTCWVLQMWAGLQIGSLGRVSIRSDHVRNRKDRSAAGSVVMVGCFVLMRGKHERQDVSQKIQGNERRY
jgi:hypothetical protein